MSAPPVTSLSIYRYNHVVNLGAAGYSAAAAAGPIRTYFLGGTKTALPSIPISPFFLEQLSRVFVEKQVTGIDDNFFWYNIGMKLQNFVPSSPPPPGLHWLVSKSYSGDVSGDIGESLFVYSVVVGFQVTVTTIGHLRPKGGGQLTPDFLVLGNSPSLSGLFTGSPSPPFYAEVKSCTGTMDLTRIEHGLDQLYSVMPIHSYGVLFLLHKGSSMTYEGLFVPVRK